MPVIFYVSNAYGMLSFCRLGQKWPRLMQQWEAVEQQLPRFHTQLERGRLAYDIKMIAIVMLTLSLGVCATCDDQVIVYKHVVVLLSS